jgi:hypothetical protein
MSVWPLEGGTTGIVSVDRNLRGILRRGGELAASALTKEEAKAGYLQLAVAANRKINFGTVEVEWAGGIESKTVEVAHGLGATPANVQLTPVFVVATRRMFPQIVSTSSTKIGLNSSCADAVPAAGTKQTIHWLAVG